MSCRRVLTATCAASALVAADPAASGTGTPLPEDVAGFMVNGIRCGVVAQTGKAPWIQCLRKSDYRGVEMSADAAAPEWPFTERWDSFQPKFDRFLRAGEWWRYRREFGCHARRSDLTCWSSRTGHGFRLGYVRGFKGF